MTRLEKELRNRGIVFDADELDILMKGPEYDEDARLVDVTNNVIIIAYYSMVVPPRFQLFDRKTLEFIGSQDMDKDDQPLFGEGKMNPWCVQMNTEPEEDNSWLGEYGPELNEAWDELD